MLSLPLESVPVLPSHMGHWRAGRRQESAYKQRRLADPIYLIKKWIVPSLDSRSVCLATDVDFDYRFYVVAT